MANGVALGSSAVGTCVRGVAATKVEVDIGVGGAAVARATVVESGVGAAYSNDAQWTHCEATPTWGTVAVCAGPCAILLDAGGAD